MQSRLFIFLLLFSSSLFGQDDVSIFYRLVVLNEKQEILLVKIEKPGVWVTPGLYQDQQVDIREGIRELASQYGLTITDPKLHGMFSLQDAEQKIYSMRNVFVSQVTSYQPKMPEIIGEVRWLKLEHATELMSFPHINIMLEQVLENPNEVWAGKIQRYKEEEQPKAKVVGSFYAL